MTQIIKYKRGLEITDQYVYIGRAFGPFKENSKWANPFVIGKDGARDEVIEKYREYVLKREDLVAALMELKGKILICWCAPKRCHGDVLIELIENIK